MSVAGTIQPTAVAEPGDVAAFANEYSNEVSRSFSRSISRLSVCRCASAFFFSVSIISAYLFTLSALLASCLVRLSIVFCASSRSTRSFGR